MSKGEIKKISQISIHILMKRNLLFLVIAQITRINYDLIQVTLKY